MKKTIALLALLVLVVLSFLVSAIYFTNPQYRKEKIDQYKYKIEKRRHQ